MYYWAALRRVRSISCSSPRVSNTFLVQRCQGSGCCGATDASGPLRPLTFIQYLQSTCSKSWHDSTSNCNISMPGQSLIMHVQKLFDTILAYFFEPSKNQTNSQSLYLQANGVCGGWFPSSSRLTRKAGRYDIDYGITHK